ncbi:DNA polymerase III subunit gamma/tau [Thorsellia kenyensis]|uniref:DNA polymerase III subunit gamma/tau n=1 Tax=Thorsellia kenyensis TaxID=1549888 RepID=A0ABV6CC04_9GAMM
MSYQVLARKWRPQTFEQVVGQVHVLKALANGLKHGRVHHAYLFSGTRGVGKTSIARLLAKGLNCEKGVTDTPCGICQNCKEIEKGRFVDLLEIDAASRTKVEDTRELLENIQYAPVKGRFKVYLIDEVHMLSKHSFNALLKTLEEPPEHVKFLLATTDPQKLPITILSRCLQFNLRAMDIGQITEQLSYILTEEKIPFDIKALQLLARAAEGSMRDALSLTDQAIASGENQVLADAVINMLGMLDEEQPIAIVDALIRGNTIELFEQIRLINEKGNSWREALLEITSILHQIALIQMIPSALEPHYAHHEMKLKDLARIVTPTDLQIFYQIMILGQKELPYAPDPKMGVEMTLLRALAFHPHKIPKQEVKNSEGTSNLTQNSSVNKQAIDFSPSIQSTHSPELRNSPGSYTPVPITNHSPPPTEISSGAHLLNEVNIVMDPNTASSPQDPSIAETEKITLSPTEHLLRAREKIKQAHARGSEEKKSLRTEQVAQSIPTSESEDRSIESLHASKTANELIDDSKLNKNLSNDAQSKIQFTGTKIDIPHKNQQASAQLTLDEKIAVHQKLINQIEDEDEINTPDEYQWTASQIEDSDLLNSSIKELKNSFETDKTPEVQKKLIEMAQQRDTWAKLINELTLPKLVEQLALNSFFEKNGQHVKISYRTSHQHLAHNGAKQKILDELSAFYKERIEISWDNSDDKTHITPFEIRQEIYKELLNEAKEHIHGDPQLKVLCNFFDANIEEESIRPIA